MAVSRKIRIFISLEERYGYGQIKTADSSKTRASDAGNFLASGL